MTPTDSIYEWKRFWCPRGASINLIDGGYLADPDAPYGRYLNANLQSFEKVTQFPCLALLGEPGIGKTETMEAERATVDAVVAAEDGKTFWLNLRSCDSGQMLVDKLFKSREFTSWLEGDYHLHLFLDSLDECLLRVDTVAALLVDELRACPVARLSIRIACRTAEWPALLEEGLQDLWPDGGFKVYELAPLRRADVATAATTNELDTETFMRAVDEAGAVPLAIKPVTLGFLMGSYRDTSGFPNRQADLYLEGCRRLCEETNLSRRVGSGRTGSLTPDQRLAVASRIAAVTVFSNKYAVETGVQESAPGEGNLLVRRLAGGMESVGGDEFPVTEDAVKEVLGTGLFSARGSERLGWAHQTYAEFLAARYLVQRCVPTEKAMSLLVHPDDDEGNLVPQVHEAAAWLASMSPEVFRALTEADPEVLLRSDVASTDAKDRATLVSTLLKLYGEERLLDVGRAPRDRYKRLEHAGLSEQLRPYILDDETSLSARRVALDIAEACELQSLQEAAAEIALDPGEDLLVRREAAHFVATVGDAPTRARLLPLACEKAGEDPEDDLKGDGLRAVWPDHVTAEELFGMLTPPKKSNYLGPYGAFLTYDLTGHLSTSSLPAALAWVESRDSHHREPHRFSELADKIMQRAWVGLLNPGILSAFARAALARLRRHEEVVKERTEVFEATGEPTFSEQVAADDQRRHLLLEELVGLLKSDVEDTHYLVDWKTPLIIKEDVGCLVERVRSETFRQKKPPLAALIKYTYRLWDEAAYERVYLAHLQEPALADQVRHVFAPVELGSQEEETQRKSYEFINRRNDDREESPPEPPVAVRVESALEDFESGNIEAFWQRVDSLMRCDEQGYPKASGAEWDMTTFPGWEVAGDQKRSRLVEATKQYVVEGDPRTAEWFCKDVNYNPALAGYRALCMALRFAPEFLDELSADIWEKWIPIILDFPVAINGDEDKYPHLQLVAMAYEQAPDSLISRLLELIDHEDDKGPVFVTRRLERCWDDRLAEVLLEKAKDPTLGPSTFGVLLDELLGRGSHEVREFVESLVESGPQSDGERRQRAAVAARALFFGIEDSGWNVLWPAMQADERFGAAVVEEISSGVRHAELPYKHLSERQVADFYIWMTRRYPHSEYFIDYGDGMITYGPRENISEWRDGIMQHLRDRGTFESGQQIERAAAELPELWETLKWILPDARAQARRQTWFPPKPEDVLDLAARPGTRLVQNGDQLLEVLVESLGRLDKKLQGETPMARALWDHTNGLYRPADEDWFSDYVKQHLQEDLRGRGVVLNREVVIRKGEGDGQGERTDLHVDAFVPGSEAEVLDLVTVMVETKGCWNAELNTAMEQQLAGRYLADNPTCRHGLYLVGWFNCEQWDKADWRQRRAPRYNLEEARERFTEQAQTLSEQNLHSRRSL